VDRHDATVPAELVTTARRVAADLDVPLGSVVLAVHARVLAALAGEPDVVLGHVAAGRAALPLPLATGHGSWRALIRATAAAEEELRRHADHPVAALAAELGVAGPGFETEVQADTGFAADAAEPDLAATTVLRVGLYTDGDRATLRLRYRTDVLDAGAVARVAGYHLAALLHLVDDLDAEPGRVSLLSPEERAFQVEGLAGPVRELPDRRVHELFEQRARSRPDTVAAVHGDRSLTYAQLNARANRIARALRARGLDREGVVAVVTERNLDWMAAVLGVFKAGGVYLPVEPHFPADRIATTLSRAECGVVVTEPGSTTTLDAALHDLPGITRLLVDQALTEDHPDGDADLGVAVAADQLAYIYFTSGSTGQPKGAMCEHAGMLNHLHAKISDLGIAEGAVVAQTAPQCFDISLWQLLAALLVGGRTHIVEQEVILDVARFVDTVDRAGINVLQLVPSYLEVVLTHLTHHHRELADLRCVSATGEALKVELAQRFFTVLPGTTLVNAYGLTETSDDTNHEVMTAPPQGERMPLGPAVQNVRVYVVDDHLQPVPLGAPGLIAFSGVCVGRGYVNDPERTAAAYLDDPHRPGERLYLGGDYGRWRPDGKLEFLGRRDSQVKISGFRIEIGEIDNTLLRVPGIRDGAVVVADRDGRPHLVAFYSGPQELPLDVLREALGATLPHYMIPARFHRRAQLPLTANGKIDTKALTRLAAELAHTAAPAAPDAAAAPVGPTEQRVAAAWAGVLGVPVDRVGRHDQFFDQGGSSLSAVRLAVALDRAVSLRDIVRHPVLADLAAALDAAVPTS
jgi:amino acid adenylation domain-containing protein